MVDDGLPGVTRFDVICRVDAEAETTIVRLVETWAEDRALQVEARVRLATLVRAALDHGLAFNPRAVTVLVRWLDLERVRVDLRWWGCAEAARPHDGRHGLDATVSTLDALADDWGVRRTGPGWVHWLVALAG